MQLSLTRLPIRRFGHSLPGAWQSRSGQLLPGLRSRRRTAVPAQSRAQLSLWLTLEQPAKLRREPEPWRPAAAGILRPFAMFRFRLWVVVLFLREFWIWFQPDVVLRVGLATVLRSLRRALVVPVQRLAGMQFRRPAIFLCQCVAGSARQSRLSAAQVFWPAPGLPPQPPG